LYKVGICANFGGNQELVNGQTIKSIIFRDEIIKKFGKEKIKSIDTYKWNKKKINLFINCIKLMMKCEHVVILPAQNGVKVFIPLFVFLKKIFRKKLHYIVIGGWLPNFIEKKKFLKRLIRRIDSIHVESNSMIKKLEKQMLNNVYYMPNFKDIKPLSCNELVYSKELPYKFCTFSRVCKEKGIGDAIEAISQINKNREEIICKLDIYGPIDENYDKEFKELLSNHKDYVSYRGVISFDKSVETLKNYFMLLFPTYYPGEGFAGTLLDSFAAGVPVIATNWRYNGEIIADGKTGYIYELDKEGELKRQIEKAISNVDLVWKMKENSLKEYEKYQPQKIISDFIDIIEN